MLRGFALFGVLWANVLWFFSGYGDLTPSERLNLSTAAIDSVVLQFETIFVVNKFITIFSFLFGVGFAMQMGRAIVQDSIAKQLFVRRMSWLLVFGLAHALFIWSGDILHLYAVLGILMMTVTKGSDRKLIVFGLLAAVLLPSFIRTAISLVPYLTDGNVDLNVGFEQRWQAATELRGKVVHGSYVDLIRANVADFRAWLLTDDALTTGTASFGKFLLGFWVGRAGIFTLLTSSDSTEPRLSSTIQLVWRGLLYGGLIGVVGPSAISMLTGSGWLLGLLRSVLWDMGVIALAASYICGLVLLFRRPKWRKRLFYFAPVGRMALTNYLLQSVICMILFYGFGLYGRVGPTGSLVVTFVVFTAQVVFSTLWLRRFRFGPAEWSWRSLTYRRRQPFLVRSAD